MRNILLILILSLVACQKGETIVPQCQAVTYYYRRFDSNGKFIEGGVSIHWCKVCGEELAYYRAQPREGLYCGGIEMTLKIGQDTCKNSR